MADATALPSPRHSTAQSRQPEGKHMAEQTPYAERQTACLATASRSPLGFAMRNCQPESSND